MQENNEDGPEKLRTGCKQPTNLLGSPERHALEGVDYERKNWRAWEDLNSRPAA